MIQALNLRKEIFGDEHQNTVESCYSLSLFYFNIDRDYKGIESLLNAVEINKKVLGENHATTIMLNDFCTGNILPYINTVN